MTVRGVIFDLDGTLANTESLPPGRRTPWQLLQPGMEHDSTNRWRFSPDVSGVPGRLIPRGYRVAIATRAPIAYASTLCFLLGIDAEVIRASCGAGVQKSNHLAAICKKWGLRPDQVVYVGDLDEDADIAARAGCEFLHASELGSPELERRFSSVSTDDVVAVQIERLRSFEPTTPQEKASRAFALLLAEPALDDRRELQRTFFQNADPSMRDCVVDITPGLFQIHRSIITKIELQADRLLRSEYLAGIGRLFPADQRTVELPVDGPLHVRFLTAYATYGSELRTAKDYGGHGNGFGSRFRSGPEPELAKLDLIADVMASALSLSRTPIVPVPSSPPSEGQPGQVSRRLARMVAERVGRPYLELLDRSEGDQFKYSHDRRDRGRVLLLDDQFTSGNSLVQAASILRAEGFMVGGAVVFSMKVPRTTSVSKKPARVCSASALFDEIGMSCPCGRGHGASGRRGAGGAVEKSTRLAHHPDGEVDTSPRSVAEQSIAAADSETPGWMLQTWPAACAPADFDESIDVLVDNVLEILTGSAGTSGFPDFYGPSPVTKGLAHHLLQYTDLTDPLIQEDPQAGRLPYIHIWVTSAFESDVNDCLQCAGDALWEDYFRTGVDTSVDDSVPGDVHILLAVGASTGEVSEVPHQVADAELSGPDADAYAILDFPSLNLALLLHPLFPIGH